MEIKGYRVFVSRNEIQEKVKELGQRLTRDYEEKPLLAICVLNGGMYFFSDLTREIDLPLLCDSIAVGSYKNNTQTDEFTIRGQMKLEVQGFHVLLIDDVYDTGQTLEKLKSRFLEQGALSVKTVSFAVKNKTALPDYYCMKFGNEYLVGYGLDSDEKYRNVFEIGVIE